jgi:hypothetical protein
MFSVGAIAALVGAGVAVMITPPRRRRARVVTPAAAGDQIAPEKVSQAAGRPVS